MALNILAVDTSMNACGVAVKTADGRFFETIEYMERGQAERLMPMIVDIVAQAGITLRDIGKYAITSGPGTFTGLRVGLATVRALAQASGMPAVGIGTFDAIGGGENTCILIETKRSDFYVRAPGHADACMTPDELAAILKPEWVLTGDAVHRAPGNNKRVEIKSVPLDRLAVLGAAAEASGLPEPVYLRGADVSIGRKKPVRIVE